MESVLPLIYLVAGFILGAAVVWLIMRERVRHERRATEEKVKLLEDAEAKLSDAFKALSAEALRDSSHSFLDLAKAALEKYQEGARGDLESRQKAIDELVRPVKETLANMDTKLLDLEKARIDAYSGLREKVESIATTGAQLQRETANLVKALRAPTVRGRWGEIQLKRVVELAGMIEYCDFFQQESASTDEGRLRPDMIVKLPNDRNIVVDSKVPLEAYLDALEEEDEGARKQKLQDHARQVRSHFTNLGSKAYWQQFSPTPEFVVLFLPGESFFSAALEQDASLIEFGAGQNVIIATPTTLIALLKAVAYGWQQEKMAKNAHAVSYLGQQLYDRVHVLANHFRELGKALDRAVESYNRFAASLEGRFLVTARKFKELGVSTAAEIDQAESIDKRSVSLQTDDAETELKEAPAPDK